MDSNITGHDTGNNAGTNLNSAYVLKKNSDVEAIPAKFATGDELTWPQSSGTRYGRTMLPTGQALFIDAEIVRQVTRLADSAEGDDASSNR